MLEKVLQRANRMIPGVRKLTQIKVKVDWPLGYLESTAQSKGNERASNWENGLVDHSSSCAALTNYCCAMFLRNIYIIK